jgi:hypothetical protein
MTLNPDQIIDDVCTKITDLKIERTIKGKTCKQLAEGLRECALDLLPLAMPLIRWQRSGAYASNYKMGPPLLAPTPNPPAIAKTAYPVLQGVIGRDQELRIYNAYTLLPGKFLQWAFKLEPWHTDFQKKIGLYLGRVQSRSGRLSSGPYTFNEAGMRQTLGYNSKAPAISRDHVVMFWTYFTSPTFNIRIRTVNHKDVMILEHLITKRGR